jgi:hypothetical protein
MNWEYYVRPENLDQVFTVVISKGDLMDMKPLTASENDMLQGLAEGSTGDRLEGLAFLAHRIEAGR